MPDQLPAKSKLYCYVDETGQDSLGEFFIVSVVVIGADRAALTEQLQQIEQSSGKGRVKWMESRHRARFSYVKTILSSPAFKNKLYFSTYRGTRSYMALTVISTARAILADPQHSDTTVYVDGLPKSRLRWFGTELRHLSVRNSKVVGVRREEADSLMCLADALAGFVRLASSGRNPEAAALLELAQKEGYGARGLRGQTKKPK
jgi:hypothetical protein